MRNIKEIVFQNISRILFVFCFLTACPHVIFSQTLQPLEVGDALPEIVFANRVNFPPGITKSSQLEGKILILDFWATNCSTCIKSFPRISELAKKFKDHVQFVLINTSETKKEAIKIMKARKQYDLIPDVPQIYGDVRWSELFIHGSIPHVVFIGTDGKVLSQTYSFSLNARQIEELIRDERTALDIIPKTNGPSYDQIYRYDAYPLSEILSSSKIRLGDTKGDFWEYDKKMPVYGAVLSKYIDQNKGFLICRAINTDPISFLKDLYLDIYGSQNGTVFLRNNRIFWSSHRFEQNFFLSPSDDYTWTNWVKKYKFSYEAISSLRDSLAFSDLKLSDFNTYLASQYKLNVRFETQKKTCLVLKEYMPFEGHIVNYTIPDGLKVEKIKSIRHLNNTLDKMLAELNIPQIYIEMIFEKMLFQEFDLPIISSFDQLELVVRCLRKNGLDLKAEDHELIVAVFRDVD